MGIVYLAEDQMLEREVAVKVLLPSLVTESGFAERFKAEARAVAKLLHPNIVHINSFEWIEGRFVIDMEYVEGPSLDRFMAEGILTPPKTVEITRQILCGLSTCHGRGIVHRDVKPSNILIAPEGHAKLSDFGIAKAYASGMEAAVAQTGSTGFFLGTPHYAPPELWEGEAPTPGWDLYSVGVVMYQALSGALPYDGTSPFAIVKQMQSRPVAPLEHLAPGVSKELAAYVHTLLNSRLEERPPDATSALEDLMRVPEAAMLDSDPLRTVPMLRMPPGVAPRRTGRRLLQRASAVALAVCLLTVALAGAGYFVHVAGEPDARDRAAVPLSPQDAVANNILLTKAELLARARRAAGPEYLFFDTEDLDSKARVDMHWMMEPPREGQESVVVAASERCLWGFYVASDPGGGLRFHGDWAEYEDEGATLFRQGTLAGTGVWTEPYKALTASLVFTSASDRTTHRHTFVAQRHPGPATDTAFLYALERAALVQPLLYHELLTRGYPWAAAIEELLPAVEGARVRVPLLEGPVEPLNIDGRLDEQVWASIRPPGGDPLGESSGAPRVAGARLFLRCTPDKLLLGIRVPRNLGTPALLDLAWLSDVAVPVGTSSWVRLRQFRDGTRQAGRVVMGREEPWACDWPIGVAETDDAWQWELAIPVKAQTAELEAGSAMPWRLNCAVVAEGPNGSPKTLARWGFPVLEEVLHGMRPVLVAEGNPSSRP